MNKFTRVAATSQSLSLAAMEEASRQGRRTADLDDLLLALVLDNGAAGQALRGLGITLEAARDAVADQHAAQLAGLGVIAPEAEPGRITFHETGGFRWSERSLDIVKRSGSKGMSGSASDILRLLVAEPSGLIEQLLARLGASPDEVIARLDATEPLSAPDARTGTAAEAASRDLRSTSVELFVPAPIDDVWALLADPARMPEWDPSTGSVDAP